MSAAWSAYPDRSSVINYMSLNRWIFTSRPTSPNKKARGFTAGFLCRII